MKKVLLAILIAAFVMSGCSSVLSAVMQPSVEDMLAEALALSDAGSYEEAILIYDAVIEIEPNNYEANYGLGRSYRYVGRTTDAIDILKNAVTLSTEDKRAMYELGYAYLDAGDYQSARDAVRTEKRGDDMAPETAILLVLSYTAEGSYDTAASFFENKSVQDYFMSMNENEVLYFGQYNEAGQKHGNGFGIYDRGQYIYCGEYKNGLKSGHGVWLDGIRIDDETGLPKNGLPDKKDAYDYYVGEWENDKPNGYGEYHLVYPSENNLSVTRSGNYTDGYENGEMTISYGDHVAPYTSNMGVRKLTGDEYKYKNEDGSKGVGYFYALCETHNAKCGNNWAIKDYQVDGKWGVVPWGVTKVVNPNAAAEKQP